jgi:hypothetical protein
MLKFENPVLQGMVENMVTSEKGKDLLMVNPGSGFFSSDIPTSEELDAILNRRIREMEIALQQLKVAHLIYQAGQAMHDPMTIDEK